MRKLFLIPALLLSVSATASESIQLTVNIREVAKYSRGSNEATYSHKSSDIRTWVRGTVNGQSVEAQNTTAGLSYPGVKMQMTLNQDENTVHIVDEMNQINGTTNSKNIDSQNIRITKDEYLRLYKLDSFEKAKQLLKVMLPTITEDKVKMDIRISDIKCAKQNTEALLCTQGLTVILSAKDE